VFHDLLVGKPLRFRIVADARRGCGPPFAGRFKKSGLAILRGKASRFKKAEKGKFALKVEG
jgi:hypothetical protein